MNALITVELTGRFKRPVSDQIYVKILHSKASSIAISKNNCAKFSYPNRILNLKIVIPTRMRWYRPG